MTELRKRTMPSESVDLTDLSVANQPAIAVYCAEKVLGYRYACYSGKDTLHEEPFAIFVKPDDVDGLQRQADRKGWELKWTSEIPDGDVDDSLSLDPFQSADDDYAVLVHVRETWDKEQRRVFMIKCAILQCDRTRCGEPWMDYQPGDYCVAACRSAAEILERLENDLKWVKLVEETNAQLTAKLQESEAERERWRHAAIKRHV